MHKRATYIFIYLFICLFCKSQVNLVPNYSFEDKYDCFIGMGIRYDTTYPPVTGNIYLKKWFTAKNMTPEYMNVCANTIPFQSYPDASTVPLNCVGYQYPKTGNAYVSTCQYGYTSLDSIKNNTEVIIVKLTKPLKQHYCYYGEFFYSLTDRSNIVVNRLGIYVANSVISYTIPNSYDNSIMPQIQIDTTQYISTDTVNWIKVAGKFIAQGGEEYLHIGNFRDGKHVKYQRINSNFIPTCMTGTDLCYTYIDDVSLYELPLPNIQNTAITICPNADSLFLGDTARIHSRYQWFVNGIAIDTTSYIKVKPNQTTTYVLQTTQCGINTQSIIVTYSANCEPVVVVEPIIPNVFTPNNDSINDVWRFNIGKGNTLTQLEIFNRWGNSIHSYGSNSSPPTGGRLGGASFWDGRTTSGEETSSGVYYYILIYTDPNGEQHKKNGYITLIR